MANIVQLATYRFCKKFLSHDNDPKGRQYDQMTQAARSVIANIVEGSARHYTSYETEMKLTDVARGSLLELGSDYTTWLMQEMRVPWRKDSPEARAILAIHLDEAEYNDSDIVHASCRHILAQREKFAQWLESENDEVVANSVLLLLGRLVTMLNKQLESQIRRFEQEGGFREKLYATRNEARIRAESGPACPECNKPMRKQKRKDDGSSFWGCTGYPECRGTRSIQSNDSGVSKVSAKSRLSNNYNHSTPSIVPTSPTSPQKSQQKNFSSQQHLTSKHNTQ